MMRNLEIERVGLAAMSVGLARRCVEVMNNYAKERKAFGHPLNQFGQVQKHVAVGFLGRWVGGWVHSFMPIKRRRPAHPPTHPPTHPNPNQIGILRRVHGRQGLPLPSRQPTRPQHQRQRTRRRRRQTLLRQDGQGGTLHHPPTHLSIHTFSYVPIPSAHPPTYPIHVLSYLIHPPTHPPIQSTQVADRAIQVLGGYGYVGEYQVSQSNPPIPSSSTHPPTHPPTYL